MEKVVKKLSKLLAFCMFAIMLTCIVMSTSAYAESVNSITFHAGIGTIGKDKLREYTCGGVNSTNYRYIIQNTAPNIHEDYEFLGWYTEPGDDGDNVCEKNIVVKHVYAHWKLNTKKTYSIKFDGNGATSGKTESMTGCKYGQKINLSANGFKKNNYVFAGWTLGPTGSTVYKDRQEIYDDTVSNGEVKTLYAIWQYTVTFNGNGGVYNGQASVKQTFTLNKDDYISTKFTDKGFKKQDYSFDYWYYKDGDGNEKRCDTLADVKKIGNITLYARWKANTYTIVFNGNDSATTGSTPAMKGCEYGKSYTLSENGFVRDGKWLASWNTKKDGKGQLVSINKPVTINQNLCAYAVDGVITLYAQWRYSVSFYGNGSTSGSMEPINFPYPQKGQIPANAFQRTGYKFVGWNTKPDGTGRAYKEGDVLLYATRTSLYAQWIPLEYTINFIDSITGEKCRESMKCKCDTEYSMPQSCSVKEGYWLAGWNTEANGNGQDYSKGYKFTNLLLNKNSINMYSQLKYTVRCYANDGSQTYKDYTFRYGEKGTVPKCEYTRQGYYFYNWNTSPDGKGTSFYSGSIDSKTILYAVWKRSRECTNPEGHKYVYKHCVFCGDSTEEVKGEKTIEVTLWSLPESSLLCERLGNPNLYDELKNVFGNYFTNNVIFRRYHMNVKVYEDSSSNTVDSSNGLVDLNTSMDSLPKRYGLVDLNTSTDSLPKRYIVVRFIPHDFTYSPCSKDGLFCDHHKARCADCGLEMNQACNANNNSCYYYTKSMKNCEAYLLMDTQCSLCKGTNTYIFSVDFNEMQSKIRLYKDDIPERRSQVVTFAESLGNTVFAILDLFQIEIPRLESVTNDLLTIVSSVASISGAYDEIKNYNTNKESIEYNNEHMADEEMVVGQTENYYIVINKDYLEINNEVNKEGKNIKITDKIITMDDTSLEILDGKNAHANEYNFLQNYVSTINKEASQSQ